MTGNNGIYDNYSKDCASTWEPMSMVDMVEVIKNEVKRCKPYVREFHKINLAIANAIVRRKRNGETLHSDLLDRLGAWQHADKYSCNDMFTVVSDIIHLGVNVPCETMKEAARVHYDYEDKVIFDTIIESAYMANGLEIK